MKKRTAKSKLTLLVFALLIISYSSEIYGQTNGHNATIVDFGSGRFTQVSNTTWEETNNKRERFTFNEIRRDEWSIYLLDQSRDISIQLDLYKKEIYIFYDRPNRRKLYDVVNALAKKTFEQVKGYNATVVDYGSGRFTQVSNTTWEETNNKRERFTFNEIRRDEWSIYLLDRSRDISIQLDLYKKEIYIFYDRPNRTKLYDVVKALTKKIPDPAPIPDPIPDLDVATGPKGYINCTNENGSKYFNTIVDVAYGAKGKYVYKNGVRGTINFNNTEFGDPIPGVAKFGYYKLSNEDNPVNPNNPVGPIIDAVNPISASDMKLVLKWIAIEVADEKIAYCYKNTYGRGVGKPLSSCPPGTEKDGLLCYPKCKSGFYGVGPVCWQKCPSGFRNDGGHCAKPKPYGRGGGYPWKFGDGLNLNAAKKRCESANRQGCEKSGEIMYPKCKKGFKPFGCCVCTPICPSGMTDIGVSCQKLSYPRTAGKPMKCALGLEEDAGLCYPKCKSGYKGVGPVCWKKCPPNQPVDCGAGCAKTTADCVEKTANMVTAVAELAANIVTLGSTSKVTAAKNSLKVALKAGDRVAAKAALKLTVKELANGFAELTTRAVAKELKEKFKKESVEWVAKEYAKVQMKLILQEEFSVEDLRDLAGLDPTGIAEVVNAFWQPVCSKGNPFPVLSRNY